MEGNLDAPDHALTIQEYRQKFYGPVFITQDDTGNIKGPAFHQQVRNGCIVCLHIQSGTHQPRVHLLLKLRHSEAKLSNISLTLTDR